MKIVLLGAGKTGSLVAEIAAARGHEVEIIDENENLNGAALTRERLAGTGAVIDFTTPQAVLANIEATVQAGANMVVGTTGWYGEMDRIKNLVEEAGTGFVWGSNFSIGVNIFFETVRTAAQALNFGYEGNIMERHHIHKKDKPSGTAAVMGQIVEEVSGKKLEITSVREGETVGMHVLMLDSEADTILLTHDAKSRRGFALGAVRAAEWIENKKGFHDFQQIYKQL
jgi:4-hydroxy-tetrahydrodipicolinate reductase